MSVETNKKKDKFGNFLYQELPSEILDSFNKESRNLSPNVEQYVSSILPISDSANVKKDLRKYINIDLQRQFPKKEKPAKHKKSALSQKERRILGLFRLPKNGIKYADVVPTNKIWEEYMSNFLNLNQLQGKEWYNPKSGHLWESVSVALLKADFHGASLKVISSKCPSLVGHEGIVIYDTKYTFSIIGKDDITRTIPKMSCVFEIHLMHYKLNIFGKYFCIRSSERSTKKVKTLFVPTL